MRDNPEWKDWIFALSDVDCMLFDTAAERVNIILPRRVLVRLDPRAKEEGETRSGFITRMQLAPNISYGLEHLSTTQ